ncbi:phosphate ABC transporter permease PstA [Desertimonas flava]|jgi:phosphate transport system permease protein|uniref:phosphate ABC transporter permease PstA n=1 Tax=Desertimonas flava TaxID=2064846 RepID=UPI000E342FB4|nr:phosphate ABC transporter permease PstA [Desertimonas flava]
MAFVTTPASAAAAARELVAARLTTRDRDVRGLAFLIVLLLAAGITMLILLTLIVQLVTDAWPVVSDHPGAFITDTIGSQAGKVGIWPGLYGSVFIGLGVLIIAVPMGVAAAIYLEEYANARNPFTRVIMVNIRNLAGVPAVVYGVLGLIIFVEWLEPVTQGETVLTAALTMSVLVLPTVIITTMEAIRSVPQGLRDAGFGVGAARWEVTRDHVLPYAAPGILTGVVLSIARALGEAAPLIIIGAITGLLPRTSLDGPFTAIPMLIYNWSGRPNDPNDPITWANSAAAAGLFLLILVLIFNAAAIMLRNRFERRRVGN